MTFIDLHADTTCYCLEGAYEDIKSVYGIKADRPNIRMIDFKTKWEKGARPPMDLENDCKLIVLLKGKSMSLVDDGSLGFLKRRYRQMGNLSPQYKRYMILFKFGEDTGYVKVTPSRHNPYHCTFYKSDTFVIVNVLQQKFIQLFT